MKIPEHWILGGGGDGMYKKSKILNTNVKYIKLLVQQDGYSQK